jgi:hypothetical protein
MTRREEFQRVVKARGGVGCDATIHKSHLEDGSAGFDEPEQ